MSADEFKVDQFDTASLEEVKELGDIETNTQNGRVWKFINSAKDFLLDQLKVFGVNTDGYKFSSREKSLIEQLAAAKVIHWKRPEHTASSITVAEKEIKDHIRSRFQKQSEEGIAGGSAQFRKSDGNVREDHGL